MTPEQKLFFRENGYLFLRGAFTKKQVGPVKDHVLGELKRLRIWSSGKTLSSSLKEMPAFQQVSKLSQLIKFQGLQERIITQELRSAMHSLAENKLVSAQDAQLLISLPNQGDWTLNGLNWHIDISSPNPHSMPGIQAFILIDDVKARGGATLAMARSHLQSDHDGSGKRIRELLRGCSDVERVLRDCGLSIVEMSGQAGDVYLMDMRLLHSPSINSTKNVRMMATARYLAV